MNLKVSAGLRIVRRQWQSAARRGEMATLGGRRRHFDCCPSLCLLLPAERQQWGRLQREFVYSRVIAPNSIATQFATGRRRRSQRRRASPGIKRAGGWSSFRPRLEGQILGQEPMSKFVRAVSPRIGEGLGASSVRPEGLGNVAE